MFNYLKIIVTGIILSAIFSLAGVEVFTVTEETPDYIRVKFTLPAWHLEEVTVNNQKWQKIVCDGGSELAKEGYPLLKTFSEAIGIPVDGDIRVEVLSQKSETVSGTKIMPTGKFTGTEREISSDYRPNIRAYNSNNYYPDSFAAKGEPAFLGDRHLTSLQLFPFQYQAAGKQLKVTTEAELIIRILGNKEASRNWQQSENFIDTAGDSFFLNNRTSQVWRKAKEPGAGTPIPKTGDKVNELQLIVDKEGIYKITYQYLTDKMGIMADSLGIEYAWNPATVDPRYLELRDEKGPVAIHFSGEADGRFNRGDYFEFYGDRHYGDQSYQDDYTAENVYTLSLTDHLGARLAVENGGLIESNSAHYIIPDAYEYTVHLEQQYIPDKLGRSWTLNPSFYREDVFFWKKITAPNLEIIPFELQYPKDINLRYLSTKVCLYGLTYMEYLAPDQYDHKATIRLNQALIGTREWRDQTEEIFTNEAPLPNSYLHHGTNYFYISLNGDTPMGKNEQVLLDYIDLTYWREYRTSEDFIKFTKPSNRPFGLYQFQLEGFSNNQVSVYKIGSSIYNNLQIEPFTLSGSAPWTVTFQDSVVSNDVRYYAVTENKKKMPKDFRVNIPSHLKSSDNSADCMIITRRDFMENEGTLLYKQLWENIGYQVAIIDIQDIYDEFNDGIKSAEALKSFISYAYNTWSGPQLKSVVFLGDGTDDERDNSTARKYNIIPVKKIWTYEHGATASDDWYGCVVGDDPLPEISVSRINVWKADQILTVAQKSQVYLTEPQYNDLWHGQLILTTGGKQTDTNDVFSQQSEYIRRNRIPSYYRPSRVYTNTQNVSHDFYGVTSTLMSKINEGAVYLQFIGHGGGRIWADYNLFNFNNVSSLNNDNYPIVTSLACYCSAFDTGGAASISEALILEPQKGAIATIGFTGLGYMYNDLDFGLALNESLFERDFNSLGEAVNFTKAKYYVMTVSSAAQNALTYGCALLGDPNIKVIKPLQKINVATNKTNYAVGDTLRVTASCEVPVTAARTFIQKQTEIAVNPPNENPVINNVYNYNYSLAGSASDSYQRRVYVAGYSDQGEYYGFRDISVGRGILAPITTIPATPTWQDSTYFRVTCSITDSLRSLVCKVRMDSISNSVNWQTIPMVSSGSDASIFQTVYGLAPQNTGKEISYKYVATYQNNTTLESYLYSYVVAGPELLLEDLEFFEDNNNLGVKMLIRNIGNAPSPNTTLKLSALFSGQPAIELYSGVFAALQDNGQRWERIIIDSLFTSDVILEAKVNIPNLFPEWSSDNDNNYATLSLPMNYHAVDNAGTIITSIDYNLLCEIPAGLVPNGRTSLFSIQKLDDVVPQAEPDVYKLILASGIASAPYEIKTLDNSIVDSSGVFINGKKLKLTFYYSNQDPATQQAEAQDVYVIYRWEPVFRKWIKQGGNLSATSNKVVFEVDKQGIYSLLRNADNKPPSIDVNVQDQEFTVGGYISGTGTISLLLSDANGIDVFDNTIRMYLDGVEIPENQWVKTINQDDINRIPIKYQLNLQKGNYTLVIDCKDVNGNFKSRDVKFIVNDHFDVANLANYPNPVVVKEAVDPKNAGRTRFTYVLTDDADKVTIKVYTVSGRLVKTFKNLPTGVGYHEYPRTVYAWDCTDERGFPLANGVYFYRIIAEKGSKTIEKTQKLAITK